MTAAQEQRVGEQRPGGRAARVRTAVLDATTNLLDDVGYAATSIDEIARRAGVHKTTIYRRWPTKSELVADALGLDMEQRVPVPDTGSLMGDLTALAASVAATLTAPGPALRSRSIVAAAAESTAVAASARRFMSERIALAEEIVNRAVDRGEVAVSIDASLVIETLIGPIWFRFLLTGEPLDTEFIDALVRQVHAATTAA